jgi:hypothetical protein
MQSFFHQRSRRAAVRIAIFRSAAAALLCIVGPAAAFAQERGDLRITVVDAASQRPLSGASATVPASEVTAVSDSLGVAWVRGLPEGLYTVAVRRIGYSAASQVNARITRGKVTILAFQLERAAMTLEATTATADPFPRDPERSVARFTYTADEIRRTPGAASDVFRAIETLPGVSSGGGEFSAFSVRGGGPRDNLILIDEIPFDKVTHLEGGIESDEAQGGRFSVFAPDIVQSADFRAGGFPAQFGGKSASVLSLHLRDGNTETPTFAGRYDLLGWEADYDGPARPLRNTGLLLSLRHENFERALKIVGREDAGVPSFSDIIAKSTTTLGARNKITVLGIFAPERVTRSVANILTESDTNDAALYAWKETKGLVGLSWQALAGSSSVVQTSLYMNRYSRTSGLGEAYPDRPIDGGTSIASRPDILHTDESQTQAAVRSVARVTRGAHTVTGSIEAGERWLAGGRSVAGADTVFTFDKNDPRPAPNAYYVVVRPDTYDAHVDRRATDAAASLSYRRAFDDGADVTLGARLERDGMSARTDFAPRLSATSPAVAGFTFNAAGGLYLQPLGLRDLVSAASNAGLPPERSTHAIAGVSRLMRPDLRLSVEGYYRWLSDLPVRRDRTTGVEDALGTGFASGVDVALVKRLVDRFFGQASYSYAVSRRNDHRGEPSYDADGNQPHSFNLLGGYTLSDHWSFSGKFKFAQGKPTDAFIVHDDVVSGSGLRRFSQEIVTHNGDRLPNLHTLNLRADYQRQARAIGIDAFLDVLDAYDHLNANNARFIDRTGKIAYDGVTLLPTFGLKLLY